MKPRTSNAHSLPAGCAPTTPTEAKRFISAASGSRARTVAAESSRSVEPVRAVLERLRRDDVFAARAERGDDGVEIVGADLGARQRRRGERVAGAVAADAHRADLALLDDLARRVRPAAALEPGVAAAERRMAGEGQLAARREDADAVVGARVGRREQERRLAEVGPARERLHALVVEARRRRGRPRAGCRAARVAVKTSTWVKAKLLMARPRRVGRRRPHVAPGRRLREGRAGRRRSRRCRAR